LIPVVNGADGNGRPAVFYWTIKLILCLIFYCWALACWRFKLAMAKASLSRLNLIAAAPRVSLVVLTICRPLLAYKYNLLSLFWRSGNCNLKELILFCTTLI